MFVSRKTKIQLEPCLNSVEMNYTLAKSPKVSDEIYHVYVTKSSQNPKQMEFRKHPGRHKIIHVRSGTCNSTGIEFLPSRLFQTLNYTPLLFVHLHPCNIFSNELENRHKYFLEVCETSQQIIKHEEGLVGLRLASSSEA